MPAPPYTELICADLCASAALAGDWEAAATYARRALAERDYTFHLDTELTRWLEIAALVRAGDLAPAEVDLVRFAEHAAQCTRYHIPYLRGLALVAEARGEIQSAITYLLDAANLADALRLPGEAWQIDTALAALYARIGADDQAALRIVRAEQKVHRLADALADPALRAGFLRVTAVQRVHQRDAVHQTLP